MDSGENCTSLGARALVAAERFSGVEAIVDGTVRISYAELGQEIVRSTRAAIGSGIEPGDRAAIWAPNGHRWIIAALGILSAGVSSCPQYPVQRWRGREGGRTHALHRQRLPRLRLPGDTA